MVVPDAGGLAPRPDGFLYLVGELDVSVRVLRWDGATATATLVQAFPAATPGAASDLSLPAHLVLDGDRLLVCVRGADVISTFAVDSRTGLLAPAGAVGSGGAWPRHFAVLNGACVVAHQHSGTVDVVNPAAGGSAPGGAAVVRRFLVPAPACVVVAQLDSLSY